MAEIPGFKIKSTDTSAKHIAGMLYSALEYAGELSKISVNIVGIPKVENGQVISDIKMVCSQSDPHTMEAFAEKALEEKNLYSTNIIGSLFNDGKKTISVMVVPEDMPLIKYTGNPEDENVVALLNPIAFTPTELDKEEIRRFVDYLENYRG